MEILQLTSQHAVDDFRNNNSRSFMMFGDSNYNASIANYIQELQLKYPRVSFAIVYVNETPSISDSFHVNRVPTFIFFYDSVEVVRFMTLDLNGIESQLADLDSLGEAISVEDQPRSETDLPPETPEEKARHMRLLAARNRMVKHGGHHLEKRIKDNGTHIYRIPVNGQVFTIEINTNNTNNKHVITDEELRLLGRTLAELSKIRAVYVGGKVYDPKTRTFATIREISRGLNQTDQRIEGASNGGWKM